MDEFVSLVLDNGVMVIISAMVLYFGFKLADIFTDRLKNKAETNLSAHSLFSYLETSLTIYIDGIKFSTDKKAFLRVLLKEKFSTFAKNFKELVQKDLEKLSRDELETLNLEVLSKSTLEYERNLIKMGYPEFLLEKFKSWHEPHVRGVVDGVTSICSSSFYNTNTTRQASIFYAYFAGFHSTIVDAKNTLEQLNGEFTQWIKDNPETVKQLKYFDKN